MSTPIESFTGPHVFLSNFFRSPIVFDGELYETVEHAFQAAKTWDTKERRLIRLCKKPAEARRLGRRVTLRSDWETVKVKVMREFLRQKFSDPQLRRYLLLTGERELVEGNWWNDQFWGVCKGVGKNYLGRLLMEIRDEIRGSVAQMDRAPAS
jgi:N-glycosidase YbiA